MKVELNDREKKQLGHAMDRNQVRNFLSKQEDFSFEIGDVLIKHIRRYVGSNEYKWIAEPISADNKMPQRYVCIHKDEFGICYLKQLKVSTGSLGKDIYAITDFDLNSVKFEVDPEYAEISFLDGDFNIKEIHKKSLEARKLISKINRKSGVKFKSLKDGNVFFNGMKVGDKFWMTTDFTAKWCMECEITNIVPTTIHTLESNGDWGWRQYRDRLSSTQKPHVINDNFTYTVKYKGTEGSWAHDRQGHAFDFGKDMVFYKTPPAREETK